MTTQVEKFLETVLLQEHGTLPDANVFVSRGDPSPTTFRVYVPGFATSPLPVTFNVVDPIGAMRTTIAQLEARVAALEEEIQLLKASVGEEVIVLRTVSREQAKEEILELFQSGGPLFFSDVAARLRIDLPLVVELCDELMREESIEVAKDTV